MVNEVMTTRRYRPCPGEPASSLLSARHQRQGSNVTYVVGFIDTPEGWAAVRYAAAEAKKNDARLVIVNSMKGGRHDDQEDYLEIREAVDKLTEMLTTEGVQYEIAEYVRGNTPARDLIGAAEKYEAELIIIGIRRRSATGKALLGSNALDILHDANVPVVCVKADLTEE
jgi:nucleotide-binding universal stress UspA family protein